MHNPEQGTVEVSTYWYDPEVEEYLGQGFLVENDDKY